MVLLALSALITAVYLVRAGTLPSEQLAYASVDCARALMSTVTKPAKP